MITLDSDANNRSNYFLKIDFTDSNGDATIPTSAYWALTDSYGNVVNDRENEEIIIDSTVYIVLTADDLDVENESIRYLTIDASYNSDVYGDGLIVREQAKFEIGEWVEPEISL